MNRANATVDARDLAWVVRLSSVSTNISQAWREPASGYDAGAFERYIRGVSLHLLDELNPDTTRLFNEFLRASYVTLSISLRVLNQQPAWRCAEDFNPRALSRGGEICEVRLEIDEGYVQPMDLLIGIAIRCEATLAEPAKLY